MQRLLTDHDFNERITRGLVRRIPELDWAPVRRFGLAEAADDRVLEFALETSRMLVTHDDRTIYPLAFQWLAEGRPLPRIVVVPRRVSFAIVLEHLEILTRLGDQDT